MVFLTVDDSTGPADATFFEDAQGPYAATVFASWLLLVRGELRRTGPRGVSVRATAPGTSTVLHNLYTQSLTETGDSDLALQRVRELMAPRCRTVSAWATPRAAAGCWCTRVAFSSRPTPTSSRRGRASPRASCGTAAPEVPDDDRPAVHRASAGYTPPVVVGLAAIPPPRCPPTRSPRPTPAAPPTRPGDHTHRHGRLLRLGRAAPPPRTPRPADVRQQRRRARRGAERQLRGPRVRRGGMPSSRARRLCPQAVAVPPDFDTYGEVSADIVAAFESVTAHVERVHRRGIPRCNG